MLIRGGRLLIFGAFRVGAYSRWALINFGGFQGGRLFEVGAYSKVGAYSNKYRN